MIPESIRPKLGVWLPNILFGILGIYAFHKELTEKPVQLLDNLGNLPAILAHKLAKLRRRARGDEKMELVE